MGGPTLDRSVGGSHATDLLRARTRRAIAPALAAALLLGGFTPAPAHAVTDVEAAAAASTVTQASAVASGWTGSSASCTVGTESQASLDATLQAVNAFRSVAGLSPVTLDPTLNAKALAAAALMRAGNENVSPPKGLSHSPVPAWPCYSPAGAAGAGSSNLALGASGASAISLYVDDGGVDSLGHRRWVLDPAETAFGSGSTGMTNALAVFGGPTATVPAGRQVPWPPAGAIAASWLPATWSVSVGGTLEAIDLTAPQVTMTLDGAPVAISSTTDLGTDYGTGHTLAWVPALDRTALRSGSHQLTAAVSGFAAAGVPIAVNYTTTLGPPAPPPTPTPTPAPTPTPPVALPPLPGLQPRITHPRGAVRAGTRLTASLAQGTGRIATNFQWLRSGKPIKGATAVRYRVTRADRGRTLRVQVSSQAKDGSRQLTELSDGLKVRRR